MMGPRVDWESILHGNTGKLGDYKELAVLPDKIAFYLYEFHADLYASHSLSPFPVDRSNTNVHGILKPQQVFFWVLWHICPIWHLDCLSYMQNIALPNTLWILHSTGGSGHITVFNTLAISHTKHPLEQRISCWPFASKKLRGSNRQDFVFIRQPGISHGVFELQMDNLWFCKVLLLFQMELKTDMGWKRHSCAFVSAMEEYTGPQKLSLLIILRLLIVQEH